SFYDMVAASTRVADVIKKNPYVDSFFVSTGGSVGSMYRARVNINLVPRAERPLSAQVIAQQLRDQIIHFPRFQADISLPPSLHIGGHGGNSSYNQTVQSIDTSALYSAARQLETAIETLPELQDVSDDLEMRSPRVDLVIDRDKAAAVGLNATDIKNALYDGLGPQWSSTIYGPQSQYKVLLELD